MLNTQHTVSIKRETSTLNTTTGVYSTSTVTATGVACNWQPAGKQDLLLLPEGTKDRDAWLIITSTEIFLNDIIIHDSKEYRVHDIQNFLGFGGSIGNYEGVCIGEDRTCG